MSELHAARQKLKDLSDQRNHLNVEIRQQQKVVNDLEHSQETDMRHKLGLSEMSFKHLKQLVDKHIVNWKGQFLHPAKINVATIWRTYETAHGGHAQLGKEYKDFLRNAGVELMHNRWLNSDGIANGQKTLSSDHLMNAEDSDYQQFLKLFGDPTGLEMTYIKSGRSDHGEGPADEQAALDAMNHASDA